MHVPAVLPAGRDDTGALQIAGFCAHREQTALSAVGLGAGGAKLIIPAPDGVKPIHPSTQEARQVMAWCDGPDDAPCRFSQTTHSAMFHGACTGCSKSRGRST